MTGAVDSARRLRPRSSSNLSVPTSDEVRQTRAAAKRSAMEETSSKPGSSALHPKRRAVQPVRKRPALSNISNQQNAVGRPVVAIPDVKPPAELKPAQITQGDENAYPGNHPQLLSAPGSELALESHLEPVSRSSSEAIASLERRTVQNLYISKEAKDRVKQGILPTGHSTCLFLYNNYPTCRILRVVAEKVYLPFSLCIGINVVVHIFQAGDLFSDRSSSEKSGWSDGGSSYQDIDNDHSDPQMCSMYATEIYVHLRMAEVRLQTPMSLRK